MVTSPDITTCHYYRLLVFLWVVNTTMTPPTTTITRPRLNPKRTKNIAAINYICRFYCVL